MNTVFYLSEFAAPSELIIRDGEVFRNKNVSEEEALKAKKSLTEFWWGVYHFCNESRSNKLSRKFQREVLDVISRLRHTNHIPVLPE